MTHNFADDLAYVRALLKTPAAYIGMLGPRQRTERILRTLAAETQIEEGRVYGPVGLDIGTDGAEQVALSVIAEIRSEEHTSELQSQSNLVCRLLLEKK